MFARLTMNVSLVLDTRLIISAENALWKINQAVVHLLRRPTEASYRERINWQFHFPMSVRYMSYLLFFLFNLYKFTDPSNYPKPIHTNTNLTLKL